MGKYYELVATTQDGLWRYQLGDVLLFVGFDPEDGQPLVRYSERRKSVTLLQSIAATFTNLTVAWVYESQESSSQKKNCVRPSILQT